MDTTEQTLLKMMGMLFKTCLKMSFPITMLYEIHEKIVLRKYQAFDQEDILDEMGRLQYLANRLHHELLTLHEALKKMDVNKE